MPPREQTTDVPVRSVPVTRVGRDPGCPVDAVAIEEPLQIVVNGEPFAVIMRTPGDDVALAAGFLFAERVIHGSDEIDAIREAVAPPARDAASEPPGIRHNVVDVTLAADVSARLQRVTRRVTTTAACGMCGRQAIESLRSEAPPVAQGWSVSASALAAMASRLRDAQRLFDQTGGLHAAGLFSPDAALRASAEDVGRHNAVDKVVGAQVLASAVPLSHRVLFVSGRTSFEIVQKAFFAGIPVVAAVSAPSTLAIDLAAEAGITLVGFVRGGGFNVYTRPERVTS
jgi:FdhD protein